MQKYVGLKQCPDPFIQFPLYYFLRVGGLEIPILNCPVRLQSKWKKNVYAVRFKRG
jgi:hypothetical protein